MHSFSVVDLEEEESMPATPIRTAIRTPAKRRLGLGRPRLGGGGPVQVTQSQSKRLRLAIISDYSMIDEKIIPISIASF